MPVYVILYIVVYKSETLLCVVHDLVCLFKELIT